MSDKNFAIGTQVRLSSAPPYLKTADTMPMLRPPDLVAIGEIGTVLEHKPGGYWSIRFQRGAFLVDGRYLDEANPTAVDSSSGLAEINPSAESEDT
jgi:Protein of unknown function (DUF3148)